MQPGGKTRPHTQIGQQGQNSHRGSPSWIKKHPNGPAAQGGRTTGPQMPQFGPSPGVGGMPQMGQAGAPFLPMTSGFESRQRGLNDQLTGAEGQFAMGQIMNPAQLGLQKQRLDTDMGVATDRMREDLAGRGIFTPKNAAGGYGGTSPGGGGVGETLYSRNVATPFGRQYQDLASQGANAYSQMYGDYAGAQLGYNQGQMENYLQTADEANAWQPLGADYGSYNVPDQANPSFAFQPTKPYGRTRPRNQQHHNQQHHRGK